MRIIFSALILLIMIVPFLTLEGGNAQSSKDRGARLKIERVESRSELGADYAKVALFRLASRKTSYRIGESISLDVAMLNVSTTPLYFYEPKPVVHVHDENAIDIRVRRYLEVYRMANANSYRVVEPGRSIVVSVQMLVGCDERAFKQLDGSNRKSEDFQIFERNSFLNWGHGCLDVKRPGAYTLTMEQENQFVIVAGSRRKIRTAVGTIVSTPLTIQISEERER